MSRVQIKRVVMCLVTMASLGVRDAQAQVVPSPGRVSSAYVAPRDFAARKESASYWVERDPRYMQSLPGVTTTVHGGLAGGSVATPDYRQSARPVGPQAVYGSAWQGGATGESGASYSAYRGVVYDGAYGQANAAVRGAAPMAGTQPSGPWLYTPGPSRSDQYIHRASTEYYQGAGVLGRQTVYTEGQPVRNFFRYFVP